jgi:hypothetical protein
MGKPIEVQGFDEFLDSFPLMAKWAWSSVKADGQSNSFEEGIQRGKCRVVSDGSFEDGHGSASAILEHKDTCDRICVGCIVPGPERSQSSCRSELSGLHTIVFFVTTLMECCRGPEAPGVSGEIDVGCDGESALGRCFDPNVFAKARSSDFDLIIAVQ